MNFLLKRLARSTAGVLGHCLDKSVDHGERFLLSESEIGIVVEAEHGRNIFTRHLIDVVKETSVLESLRDGIDEVVSDLRVEAVVLSKACIGNPKLSVGVEDVLVLKLSDTTTILSLRDHVLHGFPRVWVVQGGLSIHVALAIGHRGLQIRSVELIRLGEAE